MRSRAELKLSIVRTCRGLISMRVSSQGKGFFMTWVGFYVSGRGFMVCGQALVKLLRFNYIRGFNWALGSVVLAR